MTKKKLATFRIDSNEWEAFQEWAKRSGTTASALLVAYIEECLDRAPTRLSKFRVEPTANNIDKRIDSIDEKIKLLESSIQQQIEATIKQHVVEILSELFAQEDKASFSQKIVELENRQVEPELSEVEPTELPAIETLRDGDALRQHRTKEKFAPRKK